MGKCFLRLTHRTEFPTRKSMKTFDALNHGRPTLLFTLNEKALSIPFPPYVHVGCYTNLLCHSLVYNHNVCTANLWEFNLGEFQRPEAKPFSLIACDVIEKEDKKTSELQFKYGPSLLTAFVERGRYSNHTYQPMVNHRHLDMNCFHYPFMDEQNRQIQPLLKSLISPDDKHDFSSGDKMSVAFYEVKDTSKMSREQIMRSGFQPIMTQTAMEVNDDTFGIGRIKDRAAGMVTIDGMARCLQFFNYEWGAGASVSSASVQVMHEHFVTFMKLLAEVDLSTHETMKTTLIEQFHLGHCFTVLEEMTMEANIAAFGDLLRAFVPLRVAVYDGQHRLMTMCYAATGQYHPHPTIHECSYENLGMELQYAVNKYNIKCDDETTRLDMALYKSQIIAVTTLKCSTFKECQTRLQLLGRTTTHNQHNYIAQTTDQILFTFLMDLKQSGICDYLHPPNFDNFWGAGFETAASNVKLNGLRWLGELKSFIKRRGLEAHFAGRLSWEGKQGSGSSNRGKREPCEVTATKCVESMQYFLQKGKIQSRDNLSSHFGVVLTLLKFNLTKPENLDVLIKFFAKRSYEVPQMPIREEDVTKFVKMDWLRKFVLVPATSVARIYMKRSFVEKKLVMLIRNANGNDLLEDDLNDADGEFSGSLGDDISFPSTDEGYNDKAFGTEGMTNTTRKLEYAVHGCLIEDIFQTLVKYGFNPELKKSGSGFNYLARRYLYGGEGVQPDWIPNYPETTAKDDIANPKHSSEFLLLLWMSFVEDEFPLREVKLCIFKEWLGDRKYLNNAKRNKAGDTSIGFTNGKVVKTRSKDADNIAAFVPDRYKFSYFMNSCFVSQTTNLDNISGFVRYQETVFDEAVETKRKRKSPTSKTGGKKKQRKGKSATIAKKDTVAAVMEETADGGSVGSENADPIDAMDDSDCMVIEKDDLPTSLIVAESVAKAPGKKSKPSKPAVQALEKKSNSTPTKTPGPKSKPGFLEFYNMVVAMPNDKNQPVREVDGALNHVRSMNGVQFKFNKSVLRDMYYNDDFGSSKLLKRLNNAALEEHGLKQKKKAETKIDSQVLVLKHIGECQRQNSPPASKHGRVWKKPNYYHPQTSGHEMDVEDQDEDAEETAASSESAKAGGL